MKVHSTSLCVFNQSLAALESIRQSPGKGVVSLAQWSEHPLFPQSYTTGLSFIRSYEEALRALTSLAPDSLSRKERISLVQEERTAFMQEQGLFISSSMHDMILYAPHSSSGIVRTQKYSNTYGAFHFDGSLWHSFIGAAQGACMEESLSPSQRHERYKKEALYQLAFGIIVRTMTHWLNGEPTPPPPSFLMIANYLSHSAGFYSDPLSIEQRYRAIEELCARGVSHAHIREQIDKIAPGMGSLLWLGGDSKDARILLLFSQRGINLDRFLSLRTSNRVFCEALEAVISEANKSDCIVQQLLIQLDRGTWCKSLEGFMGTFPRTYSVLWTLWRSVFAIVPMLWLYLSKYLPPSFSFPSNKALHAEALKALLVERAGGVVVGGCLSAKDRTGCVRIMLGAYQDYIAKFQEAPYPTGTVSFYLLPFVKKVFLRSAITTNYCSGHAPFVAHANTPGACGLKNTFWILGGDDRAQISKTVENSATPLAWLALPYAQRLSRLNKFYYFE